MSEESARSSFSNISTAQPTSSESAYEQPEIADQEIVFYRCDQFMQTIGSEVVQLIFYDEDSNEVDRVMHAWPLTQEMVPYFIEEEKKTTPERNYYKVAPGDSYIYALHWPSLDRYMTYSGKEGILSMPVFAPPLEEFDSEKHIGEVVRKNENEWFVNVPYEVIFSSSKISYYE
jgi:hypothetical protein